MGTPWEDRGGVWCKRDDLFEFGGVAGGKVRTCVHLAEGAVGLVTAGAADSPQVNIVAHVAAALGLPARVHVPARTRRSPEIEMAAAAGAEVVEHRPGYNSVIIARARADVAQTGWRYIPFGMECAEAVEATAAQVAGMPPVPRLVVPVGSGMSLAGVLWGLHRAGLRVPVVGVAVGADPTERLQRWAPAGWERMAHLIRHPAAYARPARQTSWWGLELDAHYEAKAAEAVAPGDGFWIVGIRASQQAGHHAR